MNSTILRALPVTLRERPLDFYTALILFMVGLYSLLDHTFPERFQDSTIILIIYIISGYLMAASALILATMLCNKVKRPIFSIMGEFYGWMLVVSASVAISILYIASVLFGGAPTNWTTWALWVVAWIGMALASFLRTVDLWHTFKVIR